MRVLHVCEYCDAQFYVQGRKEVVVCPRCKSEQEGTPSQKVPPE